ncbi:MAG: tRNA preQ1(34) S-adenosylmethionine ribosyltransferase-isomerase QueA [Spirochaetes bacterium]|nr:tRNA preQ1(34) S-adenosylmethionine ribosyltransferase-isomerase QueA [Spirochaetota bacterium]
MEKNLFLLSSYDFDLPESYIAIYPRKERDRAKLLIVNKKGDIIKDTYFFDIENFINENDLLILNNTKVIKSQLNAILYNKNLFFNVNLVEAISERKYLAFIKNRKKLKFGDILIVNKEFEKHYKIENNFILNDSLLYFKVNKFIDDKVEIEFNKPVNYDLLEKYGNIPIPPYLKRKPIQIDEEYYQTVYSKEPGSFAAPTAGLHFTYELLEKLKNKGVLIDYLTLNIGAGTFNPIRTENINDHKMHEEEYFLSKELVDKINRTKKMGNKVIACGTTTLRALEGNYFSYNQLKEGYHRTDIFIKPNFEFKVVDSLITNFHTPKSTLLILVCAFAGYDNIFKYYEYAKENKYKFFSYGDAMFIL